MKFRLHVIGIPITKTTKDYSTCAFTQKCRLFCYMMTMRGHTVIHYGTEGSDPICTENVNVLNNTDYMADYYMNVPGTSNKQLNENLDTRAYWLFVENTIREIESRLQPTDIILPFWGSNHEPICKHFYDKAYVVEPGIGYMGCFAPYKIFESNMMMSLINGRYDRFNNPPWYDVVIPPFFNVAGVEYNLKSRTDVEDPYFFFIGRIGEHKGLHIAKQVCELLGVHLKVAGPYTPENEYLLEGTDYLGVLDLERRNELMRGAIAVFMPTCYYEPFGYVQVEAMLCGTPVITTDWGAFPEVNIEGKTGYRCRTYEDFVNAALHCLNGDINYKTCREYGARYSFAKIAPLYEKYFTDIVRLSEGGWYTIPEELQERINKFKSK